MTAIHQSRVGDRGPEMLPRSVVLVRHGSTAWSKSGQHTGRTDLELHDDGREEARALARRLAGTNPLAVFTSPLRRAIDTCKLSGFGDGAEVLDDLAEWDYGDLEGRTTAEIRSGWPGWSLWDDGCPNGETAADVGARADRALARMREVAGDGSTAPVLVFAHGHLLRVLAARWLELPPRDGRLLTLTPSSISRLGWEHESAVISVWNS